MKMLQNCTRTAHRCSEAFFSYIFLSCKESRTITDKTNVIQNKRYSGLFSEEFGYSSVRFGHADDLRHEVVEHAFVQPVRYASDQHRHQEHFEWGVFVK